MSMIRKNRLFTPGPTQLLPAAQLAMAAATMHHRTAEFRAIYSKVLADLKIFVGTKNDVVLFTASGTGAMEAAVSNLTSPGDKVLVATAGKFGERWESLAKAFGCQVDVLREPYGGTVTAQAVKAKITPDHKALFIQGTEVSSKAPTLCWWWTPSPAWAPRGLTWMVGALTSLLAGRRRR